MRQLFPSVVLWLSVPTTIVSFGCQQRAEDSTARKPAASSIAIDDDAGRRVRLALPARRIASLSPSNTEILFAIGCGDRVVVRDRASDFPPAARKLPATDAFRLAADHVAGYRPDLVLVSHGEAARVKTFKTLGLPVAILDPRTVEQVLANIRTVGKLCGAAQRAKRLASQLKARVAKVRRATARRQRVSVYVEIDGADPARPWTAGRGSFVDQLLELAGGRNVIRSERPFLQVNAEAVIRTDPQVILLAATGSPGLNERSRDALQRRPGWRLLRALRKGRIIDRIDGAILTRPGPRLVEGLEALAAALSSMQVAR